MERDFGRPSKHGVRTDTRNLYVMMGREARGGRREVGGERCQMRRAIPDL
ncbi:Uncharacterized protein dnm_064730 [Desulfonema magnum]|uniref:Uncharacterized protein n=1 Tax=Desulfonema magnum TaxID=45655 RepID=A0A975BRK2_9BACT|nr:Uncharacterized protein dnm_064730 [Desulfonema magnum]